jgi:hypothetical protein
MRLQTVLAIGVVTVVVGCSRSAMNPGRASSRGDAGGNGSATTASPDASTKGDTVVGAADARPVADLPAAPTATSADAAADARSVADLPAEPTVTSADAAADARSVADLPAERAVTDEDCIVAIRTDICCANPFVISRHEIDEDPCIQEYYSSAPPPAECLAARRPPSCKYLDCQFEPPLTRIVGRGRDGTCQFLSECETDDDCVWAEDARECCGCPAYYPRSMLAADRCLAALEPGSSSDCPDSLCANIRCVAPTCPPQTGKCTANPRQAAAGVKACSASPNS